MARGISDLVLHELGDRPDLAVIGQGEIRDMLELEAQRQLVGCTDESCLAELVGALGTLPLGDCDGTGNEERKKAVDSHLQSR